MPDHTCCGSGSEETALPAFYYSEQVCSFWSHIGEWMTYINTKQLALLDVSFAMDNVDPRIKVRNVVFLMILAVARMVIWTMWKKGLYDSAKFFHCDLILFFRYQLKVKIRCDRKCLDCIIFNKRWVNAASLVVQKRAVLESSLPPLHVYGDDSPNSSGPHHQLVNFVPLSFPVSCMMCVIGPAI